MANPKLDSLLAKPLGLISLCAIAITTLIFFKLLGVDSASIYTIMLPSFIALPLSFVLNALRLRRNREESAPK